MPLILVERKLGIYQKKNNKGKHVVQHMATLTSGIKLTKSLWLNYNPPFLIDLPPLPLYIFRTFVQSLLNTNTII